MNEEKERTVTNSYMGEAARPAIDSKIEAFRSGDMC